MEALHTVADGDETRAAGQTQQFVTFSVAGEMFAVPMAPVQEIIRVPDVARMPLTPPALEGLANLRGRVLPIISLRRLFGTPERDFTKDGEAVLSFTKRTEACQAVGTESWGYRAEEDYYEECYWD